MLLAEVIIPLAVEGTYSYEVPEALRVNFPELAPGCRVVVPFGTKRYYTGVVRSLVEEGEPRKVKSVEQILDARPLVSAEVLGLWDWLSYYYVCPLGSVLRVALPSGLLPESKTTLSLNPNFSSDAPLTATEVQVLDTLSSLGGRAVLVDRLEKLLGRRLTNPILHLVALGAVITEEELQHSYRPRLVRYLSLEQRLQEDETALSEVYAGLTRAPRQAMVLESFLRLLEESGQSYSGSLHRSLLLEHLPQSTAPLRALIDKGILKEVLAPKSRLEMREDEEITQSLPSVPPLEKPVSLYWAKTIRAKEEYLLAQVKQTLQAGGQVLFLTPTVNPTPSSFSFLSRLMRLSAGQTYTYHSLLSEALRVETFTRLSSFTEPALVIGTRAAVFLPLPRLSLVVLDEEQEYLYKQQINQPLYHARDVALWRANQCGAKVLLASTTPSAEVVFHALRGKYALIRDEREDVTSTVSLPRLTPIDLKGLRRSKDMPYGYALSPYIYDRMKAVLEEGKAVLLLQNRRGYAPYLLCNACNARILCPHCDVSLSYHQARGMLLCHYCGYTESLPEACPHCGATEVETKRGRIPALRQVGYGVERVEEEVQRLFPEQSVVRIDSDSLASRKKQLELQARLESEGADILVGTQLIKGQSVWGEVGLIGVVQLDAVLGYPDFRSYERAFQLLTQLRLRGAEQKGGKPEFLIQTNDAENTFLSVLEEGDYEAFIRKTLSDREALHYPPFCRMTYIYLKGKDARLLGLVGLHLVRYLRALLPSEQVSEALSPEVGRVDGKYIQRILVRRPLGTSYREERVAFRASLAQLHTTLPESRRVTILFDVDPL